MSEEHSMGPYMSVCLSRFPCGVDNLHNWGTLLHNSENIFFFLIIISVVIVIPWPCLHGLDAPLPLPSQVRSSRPQEDQDCPRRASPPTGLCHLQGLQPHPQVMATTPSPNWDFLFNPWGFTIRALLHDACFIGAWPPALHVPGALPPGYLVSSSPELWKSIFFPGRALTKMGWTSTSPCRLVAHSRLPHFGALLLGIAPLALPLLFCTLLDPYYLTPHPGLRKDLDYPRGFCHHRARLLLGQPLFCHPNVMLPVSTPNQDYLNPGALPSWSPSPGCLLCWGLVPSNYCLCFYHPSCNISATMPCMMWHEEHRWNVSILQRVHLSNLVFSCSLWQLILIAFYCSFENGVISCDQIYFYIGCLKQAANSHGHIHALSLLSQPHLT
jgi:hypothetical protein